MARYRQTLLTLCLCLLVGGVSRWLLSVAALLHSPFCLSGELYSAPS